MGLTHGSVGPFFKHLGTVLHPLAKAIFDILRQTDIFPPKFGGLGNNVYLCCRILRRTANATLIYDARMSIGNLSASSYLCYSSGYRAFKPTDATFSAEKNNVRASTFLRPVATITLTKD